ncbi:MAG TPA: multidrug ABC transporter ATP-binding protein [Firmicutes bacterium]|jgi:ATP-binding cassette, subfamily B, multidrug efflux pump|nr:multidrug ABC transporter ATP-binding protein [Bacillota bacterium]
MDPQFANSRPKVKKGLIILSDEEEFDDKRPFDSHLLRRTIIYLKPYRLKICAMISAAIVAIVAALLLPYLLGIGIDNYISKHDPVGLSKVALIYIGVSIMQYLGLYLQNNLMNFIGQQAIFDIRRDLFEHIQFLSASFFDRQKTGRIMLRVTNDVNSLEELLTSGVSTAFADTLTLVGLLGMMIWLDWRMSLIILIIMPFTIWLAVFIRNRMLRVSRKMRRTLSAVNSNLNESLMGVRVTQAFSREKVNMSLFAAINQENFLAGLKFIPLNAFFWPAIGFVNVIGTASVVLVGGILYIHSWITLGTIASFSNYINRFFQPIQNLSNLFNIISNAMASCERIFELIDFQPEVSDPENPFTIKKIHGAVTFNHVDFGYDSEKLILKDFNLKVDPGEVIAVVGPTGAGKTTIINLLSRFYDPFAGSIKIDDIDLRDVSQQAYRKQIAVVLQDTFIFSGTIADNIRYGKPDATMSEVIAAAKAVGIHHYIVSLSDGYHSEVHERGSSLSVGQRQLIAFARALVRDPRILILDEATSSIDTQTEKELQNALMVLLKGRTSFIIAHRLSTIQSADRIIVIQNGKIAESGSHNDLIKCGGIYARLCEQQYRAG